MDRRSRNVSWKKGGGDCEGERICESVSVDTEMTVEQNMATAVCGGMLIFA